jgi:2'-5' RNA ligase
MRAQQRKDAALKTPTAAVVWIPPQDVWDPIQAIRRRYDRHVTRWMPHVTLLYPFLPREQFDAIEPVLKSALAEIPPFEADLRDVRSFEHSPHSHTMWIAPEPLAAFQELQSVLQSQAPECNDVSNYPGGYTPHLSVGQSHGPPELPRRMADVRSGWSPVRVQVGEIALIHRVGETPFIVDRTIPLG